MKFKDFQAPVLFPSTFKALNLGEKIQVLSRTFKDALEPCWKHQFAPKISQIFTSNYCNSIHKLNNVYNEYMYNTILCNKMHNVIMINNE